MVYHITQPKRNRSTQTQEGLELFRRKVALAIGTLYVAWTLFGVFLLVAIGNYWFLASSAILTYAFYQVVNHYFGRTMERED